MKKYLLTLICVVLASSAFSQIGAKVSVISPRGDLGPQFKKGAEYELYYFNDFAKDKVLTRVGFFYSKLQSRLDTFPIYGVKQDYSQSPDPVILPGYLSYHKMSLYGFYIDIAYRAVKVKKFSLYAGIGITGGYMDYSYDRGIETLVIANGVVRNDEIYGIRTSIQGYYDLNKHIKIGAEYMHNLFTGEKYVGNYTHSLLGINLLYTIKAK